MSTHSVNNGMIEVNSTEVGEISGEMVAKRAGELALIAGRPVTQADREQALRELTGGGAMSPGQAVLESAPEDQRWDPIPGSKGHQAEVSASEDQDEDGQNESARLYGEGVMEAAHDQMLLAASTTVDGGL